MVNVGKYTVRPMDGMGFFQKVEAKSSPKMAISTGGPSQDLRTFSTPLNWEGVPTVLG